MIWCVEDDASILDIEVYTLRSTGFQAQGFADGGAFWSALESARELPELVVLDVMLPGVDGVELLRRMRAAPATRSIPVVMATARGAEYDKIQALDLGADYYLTKPFGVMELVSCVKAVLRRCARPIHVLHLSGLTLDQDAHTVSCDGQRVPLTYKEYELLRLFLSHPGMAFTRDQLMAQVWGTDYCGETRTVDMHIRTLRQKLRLRRSDPDRPQCGLPAGGTRMTKKIFRSFMLSAVAVLLAGVVIVMTCLYSYFASVQESQLQDQLQLAAAAVETEGTDYLKGLTANRYRLTWIAADGSVLCDTKRDAESLENHGDRLEVREALRTGSGSSTRYSSTLLEKTSYYAQRMPDGSVLRISVSRATVGMLVLGMLPAILLAAAAALVLSGLLAGRLSRWITAPLNALDLEHPLENDTYEELSPLLCRINVQRQQIDRQLTDLRRRSDEFRQITSHMQEGLVLLNESGAVLSINAAACRVFGTGESCLGQDFLTVDRGRDVSDALASAMDAGHSEVRVQRLGRIYQFDISRIQSGPDTLGAVLLAFDITQQETAEQSRREFTANVSHELKTPLQGIIGSAELIENGLVKQEDLPRFVGHIRREAQRLVALIGDIIRLSQLDEGDPLPWERVDVSALCRDIAADLRDKSEKSGTAITVERQIPVEGVRRLLYETVYNLCDNAIQYNVPGGSVRVTVTDRGDSAAISVADTGIGIAPEHQSRVFERFYRVDKSHSKASGGTGLGLSIVKHAVAYHHGTLDLESQPGKGTTITVTIPKKKP